MEFMFSAGMDGVAFAPVLFGHCIPPGIRTAYNCLRGKSPPGVRGGEAVA